MNFIKYYAQQEHVLLAHHKQHRDSNAIWKQSWINLHVRFNYVKEFIQHLLGHLCYKFFIWRYKNISSGSIYLIPWAFSLGKHGVQYS